MRVRRAYSVVLLTLFTLLTLVGALLLLGSPPVRAQDSETTSRIQELSWSSSYPTDLKVVGHLGGDATVVVISGTYAYVGFGPKLLVMDISNPDRLTLVGSHLFDGLVMDIELMGPYAYIAADDAGLRVLDISTPAAPREVGAYDRAGIVSLTRSGTHLYVAWLGLTHLPRVGPVPDSEVLVLDISRPSQPASIGSSGRFVGLYHQRVDLTIVGSYLYATGGTLIVIDIANPADPRFVNRFGVNVGSFAVVGGYGYLAGVSGLHRMDLSNPITPTIIASYPVASERVEVVDNVAYLAAGTNGLRLLDISDPATFHEIGAYQATDLVGFDVAVQKESNRLYLAGGPAGLRLLDISTLATPTEVAVYDPPRVGHAKEVVVEDHFAYVIASYASSVYDEDQALFVVDIANPAAPVVVGLLEIPQDITELDVQESYVYLMGSSDLRIIDVSQASTPTEVALYQPPGLSADVTYGMAVAGRYAYLAYGEQFRILDVSNPSAPQPVSAITPGYSNGVVVDGVYAYLSGSSLRILDISNPQAPVLVGSSEEGRYASMAVSDGYLHAIHNTASIGGNILYYWGYLTAIDISDPAHPLVQGGAIYYPEWASELDAVGNQLYLAHPEGLRVLDKTNPISPVLAVSYDSAGSPQSVAVGSGLIALADFQGGLLLLRQESIVSGTIRQTNGLPFEGVTLTLGSGQSTTSDAAGHYTFTQITPDTYTLTPTLPGYRFWPPTRTVTVPPPARDQNFTILPLPVSETLDGDSAIRLSYTDTQGLPTELLFAAGVVTQSTTITLTPTLATHEPGYHFTGHAFEVEATQGGSRLESFSLPVTVTIRYSDAEVVPTRERELVLWGWTGNGWEDAAESCQPASGYQRNEAANRLSVAICQTGRYALFGPTNRLHLPLMR